jgi:hypothetical protein
MKRKDRDRGRDRDRGMDRDSDIDMGKNTDIVNTGCMVSFRYFFAFIFRFRFHIVSLRSETSDAPYSLVLSLINDLNGLNAMGLCEYPLVDRHLDYEVFLSDIAGRRNSSAPATSAE